MVLTQGNIKQKQNPICLCTPISLSLFLLHSSFFLRRHYYLFLNYPTFIPNGHCAVQNFVYVLSLNGQTITLFTSPGYTTIFSDYTCAIFFMMFAISSLAAATTALSLFASSSATYSSKSNSNLAIYWVNLGFLD